MSLPLAEELAQSLNRYAPNPGERALDSALIDAFRQTGRLSRGLLATRTALATGLERETALLFGCALEFWHLASLILDDLPCMDDATRRRGAPCLHRVHGESTALLVAMALLNRAYQLAGNALARFPVGARQDALAGIDELLGPQGILGGQSMDLRYDPNQAEMRAPGRIAWRKTGSLLWLSVKLPTSGRLSSTERLELHRMAVYWGVAYQLIDDLLDLRPDRNSGKDSYRDSLMNRPNSVSILGLAGAQARLERLLRLAESNLSRLSDRSARWNYLRDWQQHVFAAALQVRHAA